MKLLVDECLHTSLVELARARGHHATHVTWLGLSGTTDRDLIQRILADDYTFVTNDGFDFLRLYRRQEIHAGLVILLPQLGPRSQRLLFEVALTELSADIINQVVEVVLDGDDVVVRRYAVP